MDLIEGKKIDTKQFFPKGAFKIPKSIWNKFPFGVIKAFGVVKLKKNYLSFRTYKTPKNLI